MSLTSGSRLGLYEILSPLGAGGMGEVYRARDTKLGREVAIKVLPESVSQDAEKLARFGREAHLLASVNHPNIATLYGLEESESPQPERSAEQSGVAEREAVGVGPRGPERRTPFLVMELVEGETLAERLVRGPMSVNEALPLFQHIAEGLETAHEKGIIHRDLKPSNIKITPEGVPKILDFGLAKAMVEEGVVQDNSQSPTLTRLRQGSGGQARDATGTGVLLGTAAYMSPEQARGKPVDKRTDVWAFGCCLFEALTGKAAFIGDTVSDTIVKVLQREPEWTLLPKDIPVSVVKLLERCLTKDRGYRLQAIGEARIAAERYLVAPHAGVVPELGGPYSASLWKVIAGALAVALLTTVWLLSPRETEPKRTFRLLVNLGAGDSQLYAGPGRQLVLSPDGMKLAFVGETPEGDRRLYIRDFESLEAIALSGTEGAFSPFFSPDGRWLAFFTRGALKKVEVSGGTALTLAEAPNAVGGSWGRDDTIVYAPSASSGLYRVPAAGGNPVEITRLSEGEQSHRWPCFLPQGDAVLFAAQGRGRTFDDGTIEAVFIGSGERKVLHRGGTYPRYASSGHLLFGTGAALFATGFNVDRVEPIGEPAPLFEGIRVDPGGAMLITLADDGTLAYVPGAFSSEEIPRELVRVDRKGNASLLTETLGNWETPRFSPDGKRLAVRKGPGEEVWILDSSRGTLTRLTFEGGYRPLWSPDGQAVFFTSNATDPGVGTIFRKPADGSGPATPLATEIFGVPSSITSDGKLLVFRKGGDLGNPNLDVGILRLADKGKPEMLLDSSFSEHTPKLSPDDRWLAYVSNESGRDEIYVTRFPRGGKWQVSTDGGAEPMWSRDGRELFYRSAQKMMVVDVASGPDTAGKPTLLFEGPYDLKIGSGASNYDVTPDGSGFVMIRTRDTAGINAVVLVQNWFEELNRLVPPE